MKEEIQKSQFEFRADHSTSITLAMLRGITDCAHNNDITQLHIVFCDWAKAFDRIKPKALMIALERSGITGKILELIQAVYENRIFCISDRSEKTSKSKRRNRARLSAFSIFINHSYD